MLTRLQKERERARPLPRSSAGAGGHGDNVALMGQSGAPSHSGTGGRYTPKLPENGHIHSSHPQNGALEHNKASKSLTNDAWRTWSLDKGGFSDFQAAEIHSTNSRKSFGHDGIDIVLAQDDVHRPSNGVAVHDYGINDVDSERVDIHARLQNLELDLTTALHTLRSRFDKVISDMSEGDGANVPNGLSDDWEFEETKVMQAQEELRSIRAKIAVLEGRMALEIIEKNKIIEEKQRRLDEAEKALSELRTVYIVWSNPASEVLLTGSFDGWTSQRRMEKSERGTFSLNLRLYPGRYEIKFIVDGVWRNDPLRPLVSNNGHENNLLTVS
uniref:AMP-activated protein kinase glycogen-binding domain-containing protein n=2 Tax=Oryza brachyantha TaxID=4533 RepID=J3LRN9_ORYBR